MYVVAVVVAAAAAVTPKVSKQKVAWEINSVYDRVHSKRKIFAAFIPVNRL